MLLVHSNLRVVRRGVGGVGVEGVGGVGGVDGVGGECHGGVLPVHDIRHFVPFKDTSVVDDLSQ